MSFRAIDFHLGMRYRRWNQLLATFWDRFPALYLSFFFLIGIATVSMPVSCFGCLFSATKKKFVAGLVISALGYFYFSSLYPTLTFEQEMTGNALVHIHHVKHHASPFKTSIIYEVTLKNFKTKNLTLKNLPCRLYLNKKEPRPPANRDYLLSHATLIESSPHYYLLKLTKNSSWQPVNLSFSFAEWRYQLKKKIRQRLKAQFSDRQVYHLVAALVTGDLENRLLTFQFRRVGLQHLLVISGFHFALLSLLLLACFRSYLPQRVSALILLLLLGSYAFYLGPAPSIGRAWTAVLIFLSARYLSYRFSVLNALGVALFSALIATPIIVFNIGFQLSFAATLGILLFYTPLEKHLRSLLPQRPFAATLTLLPLDKLGYFITSYLRKVLALNGAVTLLTLPLVLFHFQKFPLLSFLYNLFFPLLFSLVLILALASSIFPFLSTITAFYANFLLQLVNHAPRRLSYFLYFQCLTPEITFALLLILLTVGITLYQKQSRPDTSVWV
ncbi:MAG: ComEC/Rec2 family competence protein [Chlamydiota bacterium]